VADALDAYRCALQWAPYSAVTAAPVPCAQTLQALGQCFMKLGRLADAEAAYAAARRLATHPRIEADWHWVRSCRANALGDQKKCAEEALACIERAPDYHWAAYHHAAWATYAKSERVHAIDLWLDGLRAFCDALPVEDAPAYLDAALCYWKEATDTQIARYYEELSGMILANPLSASNQAALTRLVAERQKLERLFPERFSTGGWQRLVQDAASMGSMRAAENAEWLPASNPVYAMEYVLYTTNNWEHLVNEALWYEVNEDHARAGRIYKFIISPSGAPPNCVAEVLGYTPRYWATAHLGFFAAELEDEGGVYRDRALAYEHAALTMVISNQAGRGVATCPEEFYRLLMSKGGLEKRAGNPWACISDWQWAASIAPKSLDPRQCLLRHDYDLANMEKNIAQQALTLEKFFKLPQERPWYKDWHELAYLYWRMGDAGMWREACTPTRKALDTMLDGFEIGIFDYACHWHAFCNATFTRLEQLDLFSDLLWHEKNEEFAADQYERLYRLIGRFGLTVPARMQDVTTLADVLRWRKHFAAVERSRSVTFEVVCDARAWRAKERVYLWLDFRNNPVELQPALNADGTPSNDLWTAEVVIPAHVFLVRYGFYKTLAEIPREPPVAQTHQVFIVADANNRMRLQSQVERDTPVRVVFTCAADSGTNGVWIAGDRPELGAWQVNMLAMRDDGAGADARAGDGVWTFSCAMPAGVRTVNYKYTRGGTPGDWSTEEFQGANRLLDIAALLTNVVVTTDRFGER
jgi:tetratricopeptide (TPR) repeat protein